MKHAGALAISLFVAACTAPASGPATSAASATSTLAPAATLLVRGTQAFACRDVSGPGGGLLFDRDYIGEAKVLEILGPNDVAVRTAIPLNILIHATSDTKFTPSTVTSLSGLGLEPNKTVLLVSVCARSYDSERTVGAFTGFYFVAEVSKQQ